MQKSILTEALNYSGLGYKLIALKPQGKSPLSADTSYKHATSDPATIRAWWGLFPDANVGIQPWESGFIVLDVDPKNGGLESLSILEKENGKINTRSVTTGSGGLHFYFLKPSHLVTNHLSIRPGLDLISNVNHVVAPPSIHASGGVYRWNSDSTEFLPAPEWLLKLLESPKQNQFISPASQIPRPDTTYGNLSRATQEFISGGAAAGTWNRRLFKAAIDYNEQGYSREQFVEDAEKITGHLDFKDIATIDSAFKAAPKYSPRVSNNEAVRELIGKCHQITDIADVNHQIFVDLTIGETHEIDPVLIKRILTKDEQSAYFKTNCITARIEYNPHLEGPLTIDEATGIHIYNQYRPPGWKSANFYHKQPLQVVTKLPAVMDRFLTHLTANHIESKEYLLDWISNSLRARNYTILTAIGEEGVGKGILGQVLEGLHGKDNFSLATDNIFKEKFNGKLENKTLVYVDEIALNNKQAHDRIKAVVNEALEIEKKGQDSVTRKNYASFYISSNNLDAIDIGSNDRRYSIIQLTDTKLVGTELINDINEILAPPTITEFALYLYGRKTSFNMLRPFRSARFEEVRSAGLSKWQEFLIEELLPENMGKTLPLKFIQEEIKLKCNLFEAPSRRRIEQLRNKFPEKFTIRNTNGKRVVVIAEAA
jgi:hypothetical protein